MSRKKFLISQLRRPKGGISLSVLCGEISMVSPESPRIAARFIHEGTVYVIGWIADNNPCTALKAGVTGSPSMPQGNAL